MARQIFYEIIKEKIHKRKTECRIGSEEKRTMMMMEKAKSWCKAGVNSSERRARVNNNNNNNINKV